MSDVSSKKKRILILGNSHLVVFGFRGELIEELVAKKMMCGYVFPTDRLAKVKKLQKNTDVILSKIILTEEAQIFSGIWL